MPLQKRTILHWSNQKHWQPTFPPFAKARKRVETLFSQMVIRSTSIAFLFIRSLSKNEREDCALFIAANEADATIV